MKVQLFIPCFVDQLFPDTAFNMIKVLEKFNCEVSYPTNQTCCGQPAYNAGYWEECEAVADKFVNDFNAFDYIVSPSGSCTGFYRNYYGKIVKGETLTKFSVQKPKTYEFTEFLVHVLQAGNLGASLAGKAAYHDACGALRECGIKIPPRLLLAQVKGLELTAVSDSEVCCGFGGTFAVKYDAIAVGMAEQKVLNAIQSGADYIISTDLSCLMHMDGYIKRKGHKIKVMHIADVLAAGW